MLVVTPQGGAAECEDDDGLVEEVFICDELNEVIELVPSVPRLHKLNSLLRGNEYDEGHEDEDMDSDDESEPGSVGISCSVWVLGLIVPVHRRSSIDAPMKRCRAQYRPATLNSIEGYVNVVFLF